MSIGRYILAILVILVLARPLPADDRPVIVLVPTTHMDIDFTAAPAQSLERYAGYIDQAVTAMEQDPDLRYSIQIAWAADEFLQRYPGRREALGRLLARGQLEICSNWTNPHYSELSGESIIRQIAWTRYWIHRNFGVWATVADNGELADITPQLAQVLARSGVKYFHSYKTVSLPPPVGRMGHRGSMWLAGLDGSRILFNADCYNHSAEVWHIRPWDWPAGRKAGEHGIKVARTGSVGLFTDGGERWDDGMPPLGRLAAFVRGWNADEHSSARARYLLGTYTDFFTLVEQQARQGLALPLRSGHTEHGEILYRWIWELARDRAAFEIIMPQAEALAAWCDWLGLGGADVEQTEQAWKLAMQSSTHNWGNKDRATRQLTASAASARRAAEQLRQHMLERLAVAAAADGRGFLVANTQPHRRRELVRTGDEYRVVDLPPMGYTTIAADAPARPAAVRSTGAGAIENEFYRILATPADGLVSLFDRRRGRELLRPVAGNSLLALRSSYNEAMGAQNIYLGKGDQDQAASQLQREAYHAWLRTTDAVMIPRSVSSRVLGDAVELVIEGLISGGPARVVLRLAAGLDHVDVEFHGGAVPADAPAGTDPRLADVIQGGPMYFATIEFDLPDSAEARTSVPFGSMPLPRQTPLQGRGADFSSALAEAGAATWVGVFNEGWHVPLEELFAARAVQPHWTFLEDQGAGVLWLQRAPFANMFRDRSRPTRFHKSLWKGSSEGGEYAWRLAGADGDWRRARAVRRAAEFNAPPLEIPLGPAGATAPASASFLEVPQENLSFSALRRSFDGRGHILRLYEAHDQAAELRPGEDGPASRFTMTRITIDEQPLAAAAPADKVRPFEIVTLRLDAAAEPAR
jgi:hypothetical protein